MLENLTQQKKEDRYGKDTLCNTQLIEKRFKKPQSCQRLDTYIQGIYERCTAGTWQYHMI